MEDSSANIEEGSSSHEETILDPRMCPICLLFWNGKYVQPCNCKGSVGHVHEKCLMRCISIKVKRNPTKRPRCDLCKTKFLLVPSPGKINTLLQFVCSMDNKLMNNPKTTFVLIFLFVVAAVCFYHGIRNPKMMSGYDVLLSVLLSGIAIAIIPGFKKMLIWLQRSNLKNWMILDNTNKNRIFYANARARRRRAPNFNIP